MAEQAPDADALSEPSRDEADFARRWLAEIATAEKAQGKWVKRAEKVEKIYNDERDVDSGRSRRFNILWSNVETLRPSAYMQTPKPAVSRRYRDKDHLRFIAGQPCTLCGRQPCEAHHLRFAQPRALSRR